MHKPRQFHATHALNMRLRAKHQVFPRLKRKRCGGVGGPGFLGGVTTSARCRFDSAIVRGVYCMRKSHELVYWSPTRLLKLHAK